MLNSHGSAKVAIKWMCCVLGRASAAHIDKVNKRRELYGHIYSEIGEYVLLVCLVFCHVLCGVSQ